MSVYSGWETAKIGNAHLDDEAATCFEVSSSIGETLNLLLLRGEVSDRVKHEVHEPEAAFNSGCGHVPDRHLDALGTVLCP